MMPIFCDLDLLEHSKPSTIPDEFKQYALERLARYADFRTFFTDGSKGAEGVGCAFVSETIGRGFRLPDTASVFTSELYAIYQVLKHIRRHGHDRCLIVTDSASAAMALRNQRISTALILKILELLADICSGGCEIRLLWVPSHVGIEGNERADVAAKVASRSPHIRPLKVEVGDLKPAINRLVLDEWQSRWEREPDCALKRIRPRIDRWESSRRRNRAEEVALTRLRIGHCYATHSYHLTNTDAPVCIYCNTQLTVKHVLSPRDCCEQLRAIKRRFFQDVPLDDILGNEATIPIQQVLAYLRHIRFEIIYNPH